MKVLTYRLEHFEGPLGLLLHLIEKNKIDIYNIPIVEITEQYLNYIKNMEEEDLEIVSDFLLMAATLLEIKSRMLLPKKEEAEEEEETDPRSELVDRLLEYKRFKHLGGELRALDESAPESFLRETNIPKEVLKYVPPVDIGALLKDLNLSRLKSGFEDVIRRRESSIDKIRAGFGIIKRERISLEGRVLKVLSYAKEHSRFSFRHILKSPSDRMELIVSFLAVLELMKLGKIRIEQEKPFSDIDISVVDGSVDANEEAMMEKDLGGYD